MIEANANSWYILATIHGEQTSEFNHQLHELNRRTWNRFVLQNFVQDSRLSIMAQANCQYSDISALSAEELSEVKLKLQDRIGAKIELPNNPLNINFEQTHFTNPLNMNGFIFPGNVSFNGANFEDIANFNKTLFRGNANFEICNALKGASFTHAHFLKAALFYKTYFGPATDFGGATFDENANIIRSTFETHVSFCPSKFGGDANFSATVFQGNVFFSKGVFSNFANFRSTVFEKVARFKDCQFLGTTNFSDAEFKEEYPSFSGAVLHQNTLFSTKNEHWPREVGNDPKTSRASLSTIRHSVSQQGLPEDTHYFFRREMECAAQTGGFFQKLPYVVFRELSYFGYSLQRPFYWLLGLWFCFSILFYVNFRCESIICDTEYDFLFPIGLSFANIFAFFGFHGRFFPDFLTTAPSWLVAASGFQSIFGFALLFFLGLGLRNRFRL